MTNKWLGESTCNNCGEKPEGWFVDGETIFGPWALMCQKCHKLIGAGIGLGVGQKYDAETLEKIEG